MSAHVDPFFVPVKKRPRAAEPDGSDSEQRPQQKRKAKPAASARAPAEGGFRAMLEAKPAKHDAEDDDVPADENADEKRIRMAKKYLEAVRDELGGDEADPDEIATRLFSEVSSTPHNSTQALAATAAIAEGATEEVVWCVLAAGGMGHRQRRARTRSASLGGSWWRRRARRRCRRLCVRSGSRSRRWR